ncbi:Dyp-type peroxidase [Actinoplanes friuliensis]|uniref:Dyp-type peroxidase n=1 Tax=Actinoplanes friuliensis DSM 7358 TaxID=1246995 RepID=U5W5M1_9ACTN|nr:dyp-type peroxidase [Actinoplanes friuliensis]AGZ43285.1 dyp-type peroxidase [Actinoplanes friuliensis DSM 7358]
MSVGTRSVTVFARIADGRAEAVRERLRAYEKDSPFARVAGTHFARLVVMEHAVPQERPTVWRRPARLLDLLAHFGRGPRPDDLPHPYLMMTATVDGEPADFFRRLRHLGPDADTIWGDCTDYPRHYEEASFVAFFTERSVRANYTFAGAPDGSVTEIRDALLLRKQLAAFAATASDVSDDALLRRFRTATEPVVSPVAAPGPEIEAKDVQGLVLRGFGHHGVSAHLFLRVTSGEDARRWLSTVVPEVTTAAEIPDRPDRALHLGLSHSGLARLGVADSSLNAFPEEFREGMYAREDVLSPGRGTGPWQAPFDGPGAVDVVLLLSATDSTTLDPWLDRLRQDLDGLVPAGEQRGARLPDFVEHFGFADGLSQPRVAGYGKDGHGEVLPAGEFVLGLPDVDGDTAGRGLPSGLTRNGSFLVYRKLEQDVPAFRQLTEAAAGPFADGAEDVAAGLVGRRRDGAMLSPCPAGAHVRRANPRDSLPGGTKLTRRHLMLRRGIPYGPYLPPGADDDGADRGLLFLALVGDLGRQFEFVQTEWLADGNVFGRGAEEDIFTTAGGPRARILLEGSPPAYVSVPRPLVTCRGGEYFLLPGLDALRSLATTA